MQRSPAWPTCQAVKSLRSTNEASHGWVANQCLQAHLAILAVGEEHLFQPRLLFGWP